MWKISGLQKAGIALIFAFLLAIIWAIVAYVRYHNKIPFEYYCLYPLLLGMATLITTLSLDSNIAGLHLKLPKAQYVVYAVLFAVVLIFLPFALNLIRMTVKLNETPDDSGLVIFGMPIFIILALAEEIMWRGLLFSKLKEKIGHRKSSLVVGLVTFVWNFPLILTTRFLYPEKSLLYVLPMFLLYSVFLSFIHTYLRTISKSIWPSITMHGMCNYFLFAIVMTVEMPINKTGDHYMGDIGIFYVLTAFLTALVATIQLMRKMKHKKRTETSSASSASSSRSSRS